MADNELSKIETVRIATSIWNSVQGSGILGVSDPERRHEAVTTQFPEFTRAYPLVIAKMACEGRYNEAAFRDFLEKNIRDPGKGMEGFIERQADYSKFLYIRECKEKRQRVDYDLAKKIWETEYKDMNEWVKRIKQQEKDVKNQFEEEEVKHLDELRDELFDFASRHEEDIVPEFDPAFDEKLQRLLESINSTLKPEPVDSAMDQVVIEDDEPPALEPVSAKDDWCDNPAMRQWQGVQSQRKQYGYGLASKRALAKRPHKHNYRK